MSKTSKSQKRCLGKTKTNQQCRNNARYAAFDCDPTVINRCHCHRDQPVDFLDPTETPTLKPSSSPVLAPHRRRSRSKSPGRRVSFADESDESDSESDAASSDSDDSGVFVEHPSSVVSSDGVKHKALFEASAAYITKNRLARNLIASPELTAAQCDSITKAETLDKKLRKNGSKVSVPAVLSHLIRRQSIADGIATHFAFRHCQALAHLEDLQRDYQVQAQQIAVLSKYVEKLLGGKHTMFTQKMLGIQPDQDMDGFSGFSKTLRRSFLADD